jgi:hypothetical protein
MAASEKDFVARRVICYEISAFAAIILLVWLDEIIDIPALFLGAKETPINWKESLFESTIVLMVAVLIIHRTSRVFQRMKYLEGILPICASCKRIRDESNGWHSIESYIHEQSDARFSHGICPDCAEKLYPEHNPYKDKETPCKRSMKAGWNTDSK